MNRYLEMSWLPKPDWSWFIGIGFIVVSTAAFVWTNARRFFPVSVNCWFCNKNVKIDHAHRDRWYCPHCEQYNGFDQDGGYNKVLEDQHVNVSNRKVYNVLRSSPKDVSVGNGLCDMCNLNQQLKVQQLAHFVPVREENFDEEIEQYSRLLEKSYDLCTKCKLILDKTLKKQESELNIPLICNIRGEKPGPTVAFRNDFNTTIASNFGVVCKFIAVWLALISLSQNYEDDFSIGREYVTVYHGIVGTGKFFRELSGLGFIFCFLSAWGRRRSVADGIDLILWFAAHCSTWTTRPGIRSTICSALLLYSFGRNFLVGTPAAKPRGSRMRRGKPIVPGALRESPSVPSENRPSPIPVERSTEKKESQDEVFGRRERTESVFEASRGFRPKESVSENDALGSDRFWTVKSRFPEAEPPSSPPVCSEKIRRDMINLNLGTTREKENGKRNFLFRNGVFAGIDKKNKDAFSLVKPAKFISPDFASPFREYEESLSRSSTPSYLCSGLKSKRFDVPDRHPSRQQKFGFPVDKTDFGFGDLGSRQNDFYPWSLYAASGIQANLSFPHNVSNRVCSPFTPNDFLPDSFKETHSAPKSCGSTSRSVFYALSVFLNLATLCFFSYRLWPDWIAYDFKLPSFNFYI